MRIAWLAVAALGVAAAAALSGCSAPSRPGLDLQDAQEVPAGGFAEVNLLLDAGDTVTWDWQADQAMRFGVHIHDGDGVTYLVSVDGRDDASSFKAPETGGYSLMWSNLGSSPAHLAFTVGGTGELDAGHASA